MTNSNGYIIGITKDLKENDEALTEALQKLLIFAGKNAGICYMKNSYFDIGISDLTKAHNRFVNTMESGHHSVADHAKITVLFTNISKMLAMLLNSLHDYATSEKSGRYTDMTSTGDCSEKEKYLYDKWNEIFFNELLKDVEDEKLRRKLSMENARYFLSVFNHSTTMSYTTSLRQWNYIYNWSVDFCDRYKAEKENSFIIKLRNELLFLIDFIEKSNIRHKLINDNKNREFDFLLNFMKDDKLHRLLWIEQDYYKSQYKTTYSASFVNIAQAQRHRTLNYHIIFNGNVSSFYTPFAVTKNGSKYVEEWLEDMKSVADLIPQSTLVGVIEMGTLENFLLKCKERLCSRAQLEICFQTERTLTSYYEENMKNKYITDILSDYVSVLDVEGFKPEIIAKTKCQILGGCRESCGRQKECFSRYY